MADTTNYRFVFHDVLTRALMGEFLVKGSSFNSPLKGPGGQCTGVIPISPRQPVELVKPATEMDRVAAYVIYHDPDTGVETYLWGGPIIARTWQPKTRSVLFTAVEWKSWFYTRMYSPSTTPPYDNRKFTRTGVDQLTIARDLLLEAVNDYGTPGLTVPIVSSTRTRDLTVFGSDYKFIGDLIDSMADRTDGFDWDITVRKATDKLPELVGNLYYPEKSGGVSVILSHVNNIFDRTADGRGTIQKIGDWNESAAALRTRVWTTGAGTPPDQPVAMDEDPEMDQDLVLLRETQVSYNSVTKPSTLSEHAQAERAVTGVKIESIDVALKPQSIKPTDFQVGDRAQLRVRDEWLDVDEPYTRIVDRTIVPFSQSDGEQVIVTIDLSDITAPDPDEGDTV